MAITSFPTPCPCTKCKGTAQELVRHADGRWFCPVSNECVVEKVPEESNDPR